jgi:hypothetical protein
MTGFATPGAAMCLTVTLVAVCCFLLGRSLSPKSAFLLADILSVATAVKLNAMRVVPAECFESRIEGH